MLTILEIVTRAEAELGLPQSTSVYGTNSLATDATGIQMGALANRVLDELRRMCRWTAQQFEYDLIVAIPTETTGDMAANSAVITNIPSTTGILANFYVVSGEGIPSAARVASVDSATQVTMSMENSNTDAVVATDLSFQRDTYPIPSDFDYFNNRTMWDRTNRWELLGPDSPQLDQWHRSGVVATGPRRHFRQISPYTSVFRIWPPPADLTAPLQLVFEYLSLNAVRVSGSNTSFAQYFENDDDVPILDDQAVLMGIKWMFWEIKGFGSYVTLQQRWMDYCDRLAARDGGAPTLSLSKRPNSLLISSNNVPDGNWPSTPSSS